MENQKTALLAEAGGVSRSILSNCFLSAFAIVDRGTGFVFPNISFGLFDLFC